MNITGNDGNIILKDTLEIYAGTVQATDNNDGSLDVENNAYVFVANGSKLSIDDEIDINNSGNIVIEGNVTTNSDIFIDAGVQATVNSTGHLSTTGTDDDIKVWDGGTFNLFQGATASATNNIVNSSNGNGGGNTQGSFNICDTISAGGNFTIANTTPNSSLCGCASGVLVVTGTFSHTETPQCDFFGCAGGGTPCAHSVLPVTWLSFSAEGTVNGTRLNWSKASELNNKGFVEGAGNYKLTRSYSFLDEEPSAGTLFYRLVQHDWDGKSDYSGVIVV